MQCLCIKNGYMTNGRQFCISGVVYNCKIQDEDEKEDDEDRYYYVESEVGENHGMITIFFNRYFTLNVFKMNDFKNEDFEI